MTDVERAAMDLRAAIMDEGAHPEHHRRIMRRHRAEWPTLWRAIEDLMAATSAVELLTVDELLVALGGDPGE